MYIFVYKYIYISLCVQYIYIYVYTYYYIEGCNKALKKKNGGGSYGGYLCAKDEAAW